MSAADKLAKVIFAHPATDGAASTAPEIAALCDDLAAVVIAHLTAEGWAQGGAVVHVHHHDIERHAASFNEGYEAAMAQHLADDPSLAEDWLNTKLADAWDKGFIHCNRPFGLQCPPTDNPYRTDAHHA